MTPTEKTRRLLDERGVRWWEATPNKTKWNSSVLGGLVAVSEWNGKLVLDAGYINVTPAQAIAATLGPCSDSCNCTNGERTDLAATVGDTDATGGRQCDAGTCELINAADDLGKGTSSCMCFECGYTAIDDWWEEFKYCPNCGRRIEVNEC